MSRSTSDLSSGTAKRLAETSIAFDRFHRFVQLSRLDLVELKKTFEDVSNSIERFNSLMGAGEQNSAAASSAKETASIREQSEQTLAKSEQKRQRDQLDTSIRIASILQSAFGKAGDDFLGSLLKAFQVIKQIATALKTPGSEDGASGALSFLGSISSLFALFDEGGYTGNIPGNKAAGIVHGGEIVFEKPIVDQHMNELLALRSSLQKGSSFSEMFRGTNASTLNFSMNDLSPLISELRSMRSENRQLADAVKSLEIQSPVILQGTLSGQQFLRKEMPEFESYNAKKKI
jgi:hypothetical protein